NDPATTAIYTLSLHDALPISWAPCRLAHPCPRFRGERAHPCGAASNVAVSPHCGPGRRTSSPMSHLRLTRVAIALLAGCSSVDRSEEHTSELQSLAYLVCRLL